MQADPAFRGPGEVTGGQACSPGQPALLQPSGEGAWLGLEMSAFPGPMEQSSVLPSDPGRVPSLSCTPFPCTHDAGGGAATATSHPALFYGPQGVPYSRHSLLPWVPPFRCRELGTQPGEDTAVELH